MNITQGNNAVLSFYNNNFVPYVCATNFSLSINTPSIPSRTRQDGAWTSSIYQSISYAITLSGVLVFDNTNFDGLQVIMNQMLLSFLPFRIMYTASDGTIKSFQGVCKIVSSSTDMSIGDVVKGSYSLEGQGPLMAFDGAVPCPSAILTITPTGTTDPSGNVSIDYTYSGSVAQVKYRVNGVGDYIYSMVGVTIPLNGLSIGSYSIEIIPICPNGYEGTGLIQDFQVTLGNTCSSVITGISLTADYKASNTFTGSAPNMQYRIDGGSWIVVSINTVLNMAGLSVGAHTLEEVPICSNGALGTGFVKNFTITSNPGQSQVFYNFTFQTPNTFAFRIYVDGVLTIVETTTVSGKITVFTGQLVKFEMQLAGGWTGLMTTTDTTTSTVLDTRGGESPSGISFSYSFTASSGDNYSLTGSISD